MVEALPYMYDEALSTGPADRLYIKNDPPPPKSLQAPSPLHILGITQDDGVWAAIKVRCCL